MPSHLRGIKAWTSHQPNKSLQGYNPDNQSVHKSDDVPSADASLNEPMDMPTVEFNNCVM